MKTATPYSLFKIQEDRGGGEREREKRTAVMVKILRKQHKRKETESTKVGKGTNAYVYVCVRVCVCFIAQGSCSRARAGSEVKIRPSQLMPSAELLAEAPHTAAAAKFGYEKKGGRGKVSKDIASQYKKRIEKIVTPSNLHQDSSNSRV